MKILAIDLGEKRTGLAICEKDELIAFPLTVIFEENKKKLMEKIKDIACKNSVDMFVVGLPVNMDGSLGEKAKICEKFALMLKEETNQDVALWDERQTTILAQKYLINSGTKIKKKKKIIDKVAATIILEDFLNYKKNNNQIKLIN